MNGDLKFFTSNDDFATLPSDGFIMSGNEPKGFYPLSDSARNLGTSDNRWKKVWAAWGTIQTSDKKEKENINPIHYGIEEIMQLNPVSYTWKGHSDTDLHLGLLAQDVESIINEVVEKNPVEKTRGNGEIIQTGEYRYGMYYSQLIPVLVKGMQEQQNKIMQQQQQIDELKELVQALLEE
jgi:hypothetical protein